LRKHRTWTAVGPQPADLASQKRRVAQIASRPDHTRTTVHLHGARTGAARTKACRADHQRIVETIRRANQWWQQELRQRTPNRTSQACSNRLQPQHVQHVRQHHVDTTCGQAGQACGPPHSAPVHTDSPAAASNQQYQRVPAMTALRTLTIEDQTLRGRRHYQAYLRHGGTVRILKWWPSISEE
jgi:hypothetical protein